MLMKENVPSVLASPPLVVLEEIYFRAKMVSLVGFQNTINLSGWVAEVHIQAIVTIVLLSLVGCREKKRALNIRCNITPKATEKGKPRTNGSHAITVILLHFKSTENSVKIMK